MQATLFIAKYVLQRKIFRAKIEHVIITTQEEYHSVAGNHLK